MCLSRCKSRQAAACWLTARLHVAPTVTTGWLHILTHQVVPPTGQLRIQSNDHNRPCVAASRYILGRVHEGLEPRDSSRARTGRASRSCSALRLQAVALARSPLPASARLLGAGLESPLGAGRTGFS